MYVENDRELKLTELESDKKSKVATEIELETMKYSFETQYVELMNQLKLQKANFMVELEKQNAAKLAHPSKDKMDSHLSRFEKCTKADELDKRGLGSVDDCNTEGSHT